MYESFLMFIYFHNIIYVFLTGVVVILFLHRDQICSVQRNMQFSTLSSKPCFWDFVISNSFHEFILSNSYLLIHFSFYF